MNNYNNDNGSDTLNGLSTHYRGSINLQDETISLDEWARHLSASGETNLFQSAINIIPKIEDSSVAKQTESLFSILYHVIKFYKKEMPYLNDVPPIVAYMDEDGSVLIEWIFPNFRFGFNIEKNPEDSGWHLVTNKKLDGFVTSSHLVNPTEIIVFILHFITKNI